MTITSTSVHWTSQDEARHVVAVHGCKVCGWRFPGQIWDVTGDLWCEHCLSELGAEFRTQGEEIMTLAALIPPRQADSWIEERDPRRVAA